MNINQAIQQRFQAIKAQDDIRAAEIRDRDAGIYMVKKIDEEKSPIYTPKAYNPLKHDPWKYQPWKD